jgi:hypothetical protein
VIYFAAALFKMSDRYRPIAHIAGACKPDGNLSNRIDRAADLCERLTTWGLPAQFMPQSEMRSREKA